MITLDRPLERTLEEYLKRHCERQRQIGLFGSVAFLLGSRLDDSFYVAHIAMCSLPDTALDLSGDRNSRLLDAGWIADHGTRLVRLLPGGIDVIGFLWLADKKLAFQPRAMLSQAFSSVSKHSAFLSTLRLQPAESTFAIITIESPLGKPQGYILDSSRRGSDGFQAKVSFTQLEWISLESSANCHLTVPVLETTDPRSTSSFQTQFNAALLHFADDYLSTECALVNGRLRLPDEPLCDRSRKARGETARAVAVDTFISAGKRRQLSTSGGAQQSVCVAELSFDVDVRAAVPSKASVSAAVRAVKQHILRSLCSRAELHYESTDVVEDEPKDRVCVHQLPRVARVCLPSQRAVQFVDYLFESDSKNDARDSFRELLSLNVTNEDIEDKNERHLEAGDLTQMVAAREGSLRVQRSSSSTSSSSTVIVPVVGRPLPLNFFFLAALIGALLAIVFYLLARSLGE